MSEPLFRWKDTIVALATPPGLGAIGIIRISGPASFNIINTLFPSKDLLQQASHTLHIGWLVFNHEPLDEVVISLFKNPRSYTGEDVVEISCHGSMYIIDSIMRACIQLGARTAKPGEFTQQAFLNGKMDLAQAEAVADLIASDSATSHRLAMHQMRGGFSEKIKLLREELIKFAALIELELDFAEEDVQFANRTVLKTLLISVLDNINPLIDSFQLGNVLKKGVPVAIIGKPNAGKSTLLNALLQEEKAIVSEVPGTTRDVIEDIINIEGIAFRLMDTAGLRQTTDRVEQIGVQKTIEKMASAYLILYLFDATKESITQAKQQLETYKQQHKEAKILCVANKVDLLDALNVFDDCFHTISAKKNIGIVELKASMLEAVQHTTISDTTITNIRHYEALLKAKEALQSVLTGITQSTTSDFLAIDIRQALHYLGEITGQINNEDLLDYIFSKFCIGK